MKITDLRMETYRWPGSPMFVNGRFVFGSGGLDLIRIETNEGVTGVGLTWVQESSGVVVRAVTEHIKQQVMGRDPLDNERIWDEIWRLSSLGRRGIATQVLSAIDIALWDIKGKCADMPLYKLLGGYTDRIPAYVSLGFRGEDLNQVISSLEDGIAKGIRAIKMQVGNLTIAEDEERVKMAREVIGSDVKLMLDASTLYRHQEAIVFASKVEKHDIFWIEEPVAPDDIRGSQLVARSTTIPIATGEGEYTKYGFRDLIENRSASILQPDALIMGGITEFMKVAAMAQANDFHISNHGPHHIHAHLLAAIPNALIIEEYFTSETQPIDGGIFLDQMPIVDGHIRPPDRPGLGLQLNEKAIAPYRTG